MSSMLVIKIGGASGIRDHLAALAADIATAVRDGGSVVVVHGGSDEVNTLSERLGIPAKFIKSPSGHVSRYTDPQAMEAFIMAMAGTVNTELVRQLRAHGVNALGVSGLDGGLFAGERKTAIRAIEGAKIKVIRDDLSATITKVNTALIQTLVAAGYVPVVCPMVLADTGEVCNVDADRAAAALARALGAGQLVFFTNVPGLLRDVNDPSTVVPTIQAGRAEAFEALAGGRMKKKFAAALEAVQSGVAQAVIADARRDRPLARALAGEGTVLVP